MIIKFIKICNIFHKNPIYLISFYSFFLLIFVCFFGEFFAPYSLNQNFLDNKFLPPAWSHDGNISFLFGTDSKGRDILSRLLSGFSYTFKSALIVSIIAELIGILFGIISIITKNIFLIIFNHILYIILSIPSLLLAIIITTFLEPSLEIAKLSVLLTLFPRIMYTTYIFLNVELKKDYILALKMDGASDFYILRYIIFPNISIKLITEFTKSLSIAIIDISTLGFLNLGAQNPYIELGAMIFDQLEFMYFEPWAIIIPCCVIMLSILIINIFSESICCIIVKRIE